MHSFPIYPVGSEHNDTQYGIHTKAVTALTKHLFNEEFVMVFTLKFCNLT
jgi:hypothetical protein